MRGFALILLLLAAFSNSLSAQSRDLTQLLWRAAELEERGEILLAWLAYSQIAGLDPQNELAAGKATQLRTRALANANIVARPGPVEPSFLGEAPATIEDAEWEEARRLQPPPDLEPKPGLFRFHQKGDGKAISEKLFQQFGIELVFDGEYDNPRNIELKFEDLNFAQAVYAWGLMTNSFLVPLSPKLALVVRDTEAKRREQERTVAITFPIPTAISSPEAQEIGRGVQQMFDLQKVAVDTTRGAMLLRDRWSKVRLAEAALAQMLELRGQVMVDIELYEVNETSNLSFGFSLPTATQLIPFVRRTGLLTPAARGNYLSFGGGASLFGLGVASAQSFASMTYSHVENLYFSQVRSLDGLPASLHIGDRFPVVTAQFQSFSDAVGPNPLATAPQVQFEDLGLTLKITPHMHGNNEITLDVESEFKVLTGQTNNDIPVIANRKYTGTVRLKEGEWAVAAGLLTNTEARNIAGLAGLAQIPVVGKAFSRTGRDRTQGQTLLVLKPRVISARPGEGDLREIFTGSEQRYIAPLGQARQE